MVIHQTILVKGKVQGVFYRASAKQKADSLNIKGFVKNLPNDQVYIEAEGNELALSEFIEWCKIGPKNAVVEKVTTTLVDFVGYDLFDIRRG